MSKGNGPNEMSHEELTAKAESVDLRLMTEQVIEQVKKMVEGDCLHPFAVAYGWHKEEGEWGNAVFPILVDINPETTEKIFMEIGHACYEQGFCPFGICFACKGKCLTVSRDEFPQEDLPDKELVKHILGHNKTESVMLITASSIDNRHHAAMASLSEDESLGEFEHEEGGDRKLSVCSAIFVGFAMAKIMGTADKMMKSAGETPKKSRIPDPSVN